MKKILFGTTALAAAIAAGTAAADGHESPITVEFSGFSSVWFSATGGVDSGEPFSGVSNNTVLNGGALGNGRLSNGLETEGFTDYHELYWRAAYNLDELGMEIGHRAELRYMGNAPSTFAVIPGSPQATSLPVAGLSIDESYLFIEGEFGQFQLGDTDSASATMFVNMAADNTAIGGYGGALQDLDNEQAVVSGNTLTVVTSVEDTNLGMTEDSAKIVYFTPRFGDLVQFGVSYTPNNSRTSSIGLPTGNSNGAITSTGAIVENVVSFGANVVTEVAGVEIQAAAGVERGQETKGSPTLAELGRYGAGITAEWNGIKVGGSFDNREFTGQNVGRTGNPNNFDGQGRDSEDQTNWEVGLSYQGAPNWRVGVAYAESNQGEREVSYVGVGGFFAVHPSVIFFAGHNESDNNLKSNAAAAFNLNPATDNGNGYEGDRSRSYVGMLVKF